MDLQDLTRCRAIKLGWLKAIGRILFLIVWPVSVYFAICLFISLHSLIKGFCFLYLIGSGIFLLYWMRSILIDCEPPWPFHRLRDYWKRNVVGYVAHLHFHKDGEPHLYVTNELYQWGYCGDCDRMKSGRVYFQIPLGGWFTSDRDKLPNVIWNREVSYCNRYPESNQLWRVRIANYEDERLMLKITDCEGSSITMPAGIVSAIFEKRMMEPRTCSTWRELVDGFHGRLNRAETDLEAATQNAATLRAERNTAYQMIDDTICRIKNSKRFGFSKEGQRIREWLTAEYLKILPPDSARREQLEREMKTEKSPMPKRV